MSDATPPAPRLGALLSLPGALLPGPAALGRAFLRLPVIGRMAREVIEGPRENLWYLLAGLASLWIMAVATWGAVAVVLTAVMAAPVLLVMLVLLTLG